MQRDLSKTYIYHITDVNNLPTIIDKGGLLSDVAIAQAGGPKVMIGYSHIKEARMTKYRVPCTGNRFVGEFVPFYYCPRPPMLLVMNGGRTGLAPGGQTRVVHLVSTVQRALDLGRPWALSDGNAGSAYAQFYADTAMLDRLNWGAINEKWWKEVVTAKQAEFLVADHFAWDAIMGIACHNTEIEAQVKSLLTPLAYQPKVIVKRDWYY